jgi:hypothetical protein
LGDRVGFLLIVMILIAFAAAAVTVAAASAPQMQDMAAPTGKTATAEELAAALAEWQQSEHARTYDEGMGANTTCARCKSPLNWDPNQLAAQEMAIDCGACKRVSGAPRPTLAGGTPVSEAEWQNITCAVCHIPVGESYDTGLAFWNQASNTYEPVESPDELCGHCHEGQHGFEVVEEQQASVAHQGMSCTDCHGAHNKVVLCEDCHDPMAGAGASEHRQHESVHCSACHDAGSLSIWQESDPASSYAGQYITRRFAHTLTSWPSHNLSADVDCLRCHHPQGDRQAALVDHLSCTICHVHAYGAVSEWCIFFERDPAPDGVGWQPYEED